MSVIQGFAGEWISILAGLSWSVAIIIYRIAGIDSSSQVITWLSSGTALFLNILAILLLGIHVPWNELSASEWFRLLGSGFMGIALGDFLVLSALFRLGASLEAIVSCIYSPSVMILGYFMFGEQLGVIPLIGFFVVLSAILIVSLPEDRSPQRGTNVPLGILMSLAGHFLYAFSGLMIRDIYSKHSLFFVNSVRYSAGLIGLTFFITWLNQWKDIRSTLKTRRRTKKIFAATFFGPFASTNLWLLAFTYTLVAKAAILNQLSSIYIVILAAIILKEKITPRKSIALLLALIGAFMVVIGQN